jgi:hypothetical protein
MNPCVEVVVVCQFKLSCRVRTLAVSIRKCKKRFTAFFFESSMKVGHVPNGILLLRAILQLGCTPLQPKLKTQKRIRWFLLGAKK